MSFTRTCYSVNPYVYKNIVSIVTCIWNLKFFLAINLSSIFIILVFYGYVNDYGLSMHYIDYFVIIMIIYVLNKSSIIKGFKQIPEEI